MERSCVIIKPDGVCKKHIGKVIDRLESDGLKIVAIRMTKLSQETAEKLYYVHQGKPFFGPFIRFLTSAPIVAMVVEGKNAISRVRQLIGETDARKATPGTLRQQYGTDNRRNLVHSSDSLTSFNHESNVLFPPNEIYAFTDTDWDV